MKKLLRKNAFTLVEVLIAMGICVVGICSIMVLFPVGVNASRNAAMASYAANAADQILSFAKLCIEEETGVNGYQIFKNFVTNPNYDSNDPDNNIRNWSLDTPSTYFKIKNKEFVLFKPYQPEPGYQNSHSNTSFENLLNNNLDSRINNSLTAFLSNESTKFTACENLVFYIDCGDTSKSYSDFSCYASVWATPVFVIETTTNPVVIPFAAHLNVEVSWPADLAYENRQKRTYSLDVFKAY